MNEVKWRAYKEVQESGMTNMFDVNAVVALSDFVLDKKDCFDIMKNYSEYDEEYGDV